MGVRDSIWKNWTEEGILSLTYYDSNVIKNTKTYFKNGNIYAEYNYESAHKKHGLCRVWYDNGQLREEQYFNRGQLGNSNGWHIDGKLRFESNIKDSIRLTKAYYPNGQLNREFTEKYKNNIGWMHGTDKVWYENGQIKREGNYKDGKWNGTQKWWNEKGVLLFENHMDMDKPVSGISWYESGRLKSEVTYNKDGSKLNSKCFDEDGNKRECEDWEFGQFKQ